MANLHMSKECSIFASPFKESTFLGLQSTFSGNESKKYVF